MYFLIMSGGLAHSIVFLVVCNIWFVLCAGARLWIIFIRLLEFSRVFRPSWASSFLLYNE